MFKEAKTLEYTLEILRILHMNPGPHDSRTIHDYLVAANKMSGISMSYIQKVLPRMTRASLIISGESGYVLTRPLSEITVDMVLDICDMPSEHDLIYNLCVNLKRAVSVTNIAEFYDFS